MLNLAEYRKKPQNLADFLPWAALVAPGVVLNKDGSFQRTARFRGSDLDSATPHRTRRSPWRGSTTHCGVWVLAGRSSSRRNAIPPAITPRAAFPIPVSALVDAERKAQFEQEGAHFESAYFLTLQFLPPEGSAAGAELWLYEGRSYDSSGEARALSAFIDRTNRVLQLVEGFAPEAEWLNDPESLTYLHSCVSTKRHRVRVPETPMHLDAFLVDEPLAGRLDRGSGTRICAPSPSWDFRSSTHSRHSRRTQSAELSLSLVDARHHARQDRGRDQNPHAHPPAMVRQTQIHIRHPQRGDD